MYSFNVTNNVARIGSDTIPSTPNVTVELDALQVNFNDTQLHRNQAVTAWNSGHLIIKNAGLDKMKRE